MRVLFQLAPFVLALASAAPTAAPTPGQSVAGPWLGCVDPSESSNNNNNKIEIGKSTFVCLLIANAVDWAGGVEYTRVSFRPMADQYSRLHIPNCTFFSFFVVVRVLVFVFFFPSWLCGYLFIDEIDR
jgi:hypothetical protein